MRPLLRQRYPSRRDFLRKLFWSAGAAASTVALAGCGSGGSGRSASNGAEPGQGSGSSTSRFTSLGPLQDADANGIRLPAGFTSRIVAVAGEAPVPGGATLWHPFPDGSSTFPRADGGWIYASNSEVPGLGNLTFAFPELSQVPGIDTLIGNGGNFAPGMGGATSLAFDAQGNVVDVYPILSGTTNNCAGGPTPWGTWLSCEEVNDGQVWECDPQGQGAPVVKPALGRFAHEAIAIDGDARTLYMTEDLPDGRLYRFVATELDWPAGGRGQLESGQLQVMQVNGDPAASENNPLSVTWVDAVDPDSRQIDNRVPGTAEFDGGEGIWFFSGFVYFSTKGDDRIWAYDTTAQTLEIIYDFETATGSDKILSGVDNLTVTAAGDILVAEDGGDMQLCVILPDRSVVPLLQVEGQDQSEISGPAFSPDGRRLYFNSNRGGRSGAGAGITYEILMPFAV